MQTNDVHQLLHQHSSFAALFEQNLKISEYQNIVQRLYGFYLPLDDAVEAALAVIGEGPVNYGYVRRSDLLLLDLLDLGLDQRAIDATCLCTPILDVVTRDTLGGVLYVVEGATLGGSVIERAVAKALGTKGEYGKRYWSWCRVEGRRGWSKLNAHLDSLDAEDRIVKNHVAGATKTFRVFADWLEPLNQAGNATLKLSA